MTAQKRETGKNYIGLLHEETEEPRVADLSAAVKHRIMDHTLGLMAAMFGRRSEARLYPQSRRGAEQGTGHSPGP